MGLDLFHDDHGGAEQRGESELDGGQDSYVCVEVLLDGCRDINTSLVFQLLLRTAGGNNTSLVSNFSIFQNLCKIIIFRQLLSIPVTR